MYQTVRILSALLLTAAAWGQAPTPPAEQSQVSDQQPVTTLKVQTRVVAISAVVQGKEGEPRTGLTKEDFVLKQDGREQSIRYFSQGSDLPLTLALMVDTSGSQRTFIGDGSLASDVFFETMLGRKEDRAMLMQFDTRMLQLRSMTNSANLLHLALSGLNPDPSPKGGTLLNDSVYAVARSVLAKEKGRKAMVILSDGGDNGSRKSIDDAIEQAQLADVQIYSILYSAWNAFGMANGGRSLTPSGEDTGRKTLQKLSESTGGQIFTVSRTLGLREIFARIAQDLRLQYELGYTPPAGLEPNSYHKLELKTKDKKLSVQARKGFFAQP